ncbi:MAG: TonB-dependent receptor plug domain-containing protein, partial [Bacteroidota bacterium]
TGSYQLQEAISPTSSLSKKQIDYSPNLIKDVFRTIKLIPAVSNTDFSVRPRIRGGSSDETAIYLDGFELINPYHVEISGGVQGLFNTDYVESIKLYPGVFSAKYTDRLSGVVDMTTSSFFEENEYSFSLDLLNVIGSAKIKLGERWFLSSSVRRGYWDLLVDLESLGAELSFNDAWQKLVFRPNDRHLFELNMLYGKDVFDYRASSQGIVTNFYNSDYDKFYSWMNWKMNINPNLFLRSTLGYQRLTKTADFSFESSFSSDNRDNSAFGMLSLNEYLEYEWNEKHHLSAGMEYRFITNETLFSEDRYNLHASTADEPVIETIAVDADLTEHIGAAFLEHFYQFSNKLHVRNSLRLSGQSFSDRVYLAPRSNVKYHFSRALTGSLGLGLFFQPDFFYDLRSELGQSELRKRNAQAIHYMANLSYGRRNVSIRLDGFYKDYPRLFDDFRFTAPNRIETLATFEQSFEAVSGRSIGLELGVNYQYSSNTLNVNYAYTQNQMTNLAGETVSRSLEIPHSFSVNNLMQFSNGWDISMSFVWRSGLPYSSVIDTEAIEASDRPKRIVFYDINSKNDLRYSAYQSVDLRFSKKWAGDKIAVECYLNVLNFLNSENVRNLHFDTSTQSDGSIDVSPSENIFFPFFITPGIKVSF